MLEANFIRPVVFTVCVETIVVFVVMRLFYRIDRKRISTALLILSGAISVFTLAIIYFALKQMPFNFLNIALAEAFAVVAEAIFYFGIFSLSVKKALFLSFVANACSYGLGLALFYLPSFLALL